MKKYLFLLVCLLCISLLVGGCDFLKSKTATAGKAFEIYQGTFQIADDALDYFSSTNIFGKEIGKDFYEGKTTLPLIIIFRRGNNEERRFLKEIFKKDKRR